MSIAVNNIVNKIE